MACPTAGPVASSGASRKPAAGAGFAGIRTRELSSPRESFSRVSAGRLSLIASLLTPTERAVLELVAQTRLCSGGQLERLYWRDGASPGSRARQARRVLARLVEWRLLERLPRQVGGRRSGSRGFLYCLGPSGYRLLARERGVRPRRLDTPGDRYVSHLLAASEQVVRLHEADRAGALELIEVQSEPACWRAFTGPFGARRVVKPDLLVRLGAGAHEYRWMVEIDMASETRGTLLGKCARYAEHYRSGSEQHAHGTYPRVVWATTDQRRAGHLRAVIARLPDEDARLFSVCLQDELTQLLAAEARS
jgi:Replication-relaxation